MDRNDIPEITLLIAKDGEKQLFAVSPEDLKQVPVSAIARPVDIRRGSFSINDRSFDFRQISTPKHGIVTQIKGVMEWELPFFLNDDGDIIQYRPDDIMEYDEDDDDWFQNMESDSLGPIQFKRFRFNATLVYQWVNSGNTDGNRMIAKAYLMDENGRAIWMTNVSGFNVCFGLQNSREIYSPEFFIREMEAQCGNFDYEIDGSTPFHKGDDGKLYLDVRTYEYMDSTAQFLYNSSKV